MHDMLYIVIYYVVEMLKRVVEGDSCLRVFAGDTNLHLNTELPFWNCTSDSFPWTDCWMIRHAQIAFSKYGMDINKTSITYVGNLHCFSFCGIMY